MEELKNKVVDVIFVSDMMFNYEYSIRRDYSLREVTELSAEASMHLMYGSQNTEFNAVFDEAMNLYHILKPKEWGEWKSLSDKYKSDYICMRYTQQIWVTIIIVFIIMLAVLFLLLKRNIKAHKNTAAILNVVQEKNQIITSSIDYASKIQKNLLPMDSVFENAFTDYSVIWQPRNVVGGDIYWVKTFDEGTVLCVCDCTGHGTPGALLTMVVVSAFESMVNESNYKDTAEILWQLEKRLVSVFNVDVRTKNVDDSTDVKDGCDLAVLYVGKDKSVTISSAKTNVFICNGKEVRQMKGQKLFIGEGKLKSKDDINVITISANPDNKFYIASDGLCDQMGELKRKFGYKAL